MLAYAIDINWCSGCRRCVDFCPGNAIQRFGEVLQIDPDECLKCGMCKTVCPNGCIRCMIESEMPS